MRILVCLLLITTGTLGSQGILYAQEEESAAVSLEAYTDEFQEHFFEALKQKGIENYDKAINEFLVCKQLEGLNPVVDHELAKAYLANGQEVQALEFGIKALNAAPANFWYLETLVSVIIRQGFTVEVLEGRIPLDNQLLRENLALIFYTRNDYQSALKILRDIRKSVFSDQLAAKIHDSLDQNTKKTQPKVEETNPLVNLRSELEGLLEKEAYETLDQRSLDALERFPSYPFFYYVRGLVLSQRGAYLEATEILEEGLDYLLDDAALASKMYKALVRAFTALGNNSKANMYLSKIKSGS